MNTYKVLLREKTIELQQKSQIYRNGLATLEATRVEVETMSVDLEKKKREVSTAQQKCEEMTEKMIKDQHLMKEQEKLVNEKKEILAHESIKIKEKEEKAELALAVAKPALDEADLACAKLEENVKKVQEIASYPVLTGATKTVVEALMTLLQKPTQWSNAKVEMQSAAFVNTLKNFDKNAISKKLLTNLGRYVRMKDLEPRVAEKSSFAASLLAEWIQAVYKYSLVYQEVKPLMDDLERVRPSMRRKCEK